MLSLCVAAWQLSPVRRYLLSTWSSSLQLSSLSASSILTSIDMRLIRNWPAALHPPTHRALLFLPTTTLMLALRFFLSITSVVCQRTAALFACSFNSSHTLCSRYFSPTLYRSSCRFMPSITVFYVLFASAESVGAPTSPVPHRINCKCDNNYGNTHHFTLKIIAVVATPDLLGGRSGGPRCPFARASNHKYHSEYLHTHKCRCVC